MTILVTGGAGFIGSNFVLDWLAQLDEPVVNLDKLSYAGNLENLASLQGNERHIFVKGDIGDATLVPQLLAQYQPPRRRQLCCRIPCGSLHSWAWRICSEQHRRHLPTPGIGAGLLERAGCAKPRRVFRFLHVSTDEVYGSAGQNDPAFTESKHQPNSPYSASKRPATTSCVRGITPTGCRY